MTFANFCQISQLFLVFLLLILNKQMLDGKIIDFRTLRTNYLKFFCKVIILEKFRYSNIYIYIIICVCVFVLAKLITQRMKFSANLLTFAKETLIGKLNFFSGGCNLWIQVLQQIFLKILRILSELLLHPNKHLPAQIQHKKHYKKIENMLKFNNKDIRTASTTLF